MDGKSPLEIELPGVLDNIKKLNKKTCIIITHKAAALEVCNREFIINDKQLTAVRKEAIN